MKKLAKLFGFMFLVSGAIMMIVCIGGLVAIAGSGFSPNVISFFETGMTSTVKQSVILAAIFGSLWSIFASNLFRRCPLICQ
jgi:hypothetical protein